MRERTKSREEPQSEQQADLPATLILHINSQVVFVQVHVILFEGNINLLIKCEFKEKNPGLMAGEKTWIMRMQQKNSS